MTGRRLSWIALSLLLLVLGNPVPSARAGDAYKPTPAPANPTKPSNNSDAEATPDDSTTDATDQPPEGSESPPAKPTPPHPVGRKAATSRTGSPAKNDAEGLVPPEQAADPDRALRMEWEEKARKADERVAAAQARLDAAQLSYTSMRMRSYPSGDAREAILKEIDAAKAELSAAQDDRASLEDKARAAGVPPSWIMP